MKRIHLKNQNKIKKLSKLCLDNIDKNNYTIYTKSYNGVIAFNHNKLNSSAVAEQLNNKKICVRAGLHCAPLMHKFLNTEKNGAVRASIGIYNKNREIKKFVKVLNSIKP